MDPSYDIFTKVAAYTGFGAGLIEMFFLIRDGIRKFFNLHVEKSYGYLLDALEGREDFIYSMKVKLAIINRSEHPVEILDIRLMLPGLESESCTQNNSDLLKISSRYAADHDVNAVSKIIRLPCKLEPFSSASGMVAFSYAGMYEDYTCKRMRTRKIKIVTTRRNKTTRIKILLPPTHESKNETDK